MSDKKIKECRDTVLVDMNGGNRFISKMHYIYFYLHIIVQI
jgi:hypothetical protein